MPDIYPDGESHMVRDTLALASVGLVLLTGILAAGATLKKEADFAADQAQDQGPLQQALKQDFEVLPGYVCMEASQNPQACIDARSQTEVTFVDFGIDNTELGAAAAHEIPTYLSAVTGGLFNVSARVLPASKEAKALEAATLKHPESYPDGCVDSDEGFYHLSSIAEVADSRRPGNEQQFGPNSLLVALTDKPSCDEGTAGTSNLKRGTDIYDVTDSVARYNDRKHYLIETVGHEIGHNLDLQHAGVLSGRLKENVWSDISIYLDYATERVDLREYVENGQYNEYGNASNVMGANSDSSQLPIPFNAPQQEVLRWPERAQDPTNKRATAIGDAWTAFTKKNVKRGDYAAIPFERPIGVLHKITSPEGKLAGQEILSFDQLLIVPVIDAQKDLNSVELTLQSEGNSFVSLGAVQGNPDGSDKQFSFSLDGQVLHVSIQRGSIAVRSE